MSEPQMNDSQPGLLRSSTTMAVGTIVSRITGMARNLLIVAALGTALFADTYNVANTIPNITYILIAGGALNAVFVPQLVRAMQQGDDAGSAFASRLVTAVSMALLVMTTIAVLAAPLLISVYANRFSAPGLEREHELVIAFARYCLPQIFFYGLYAMLGQITTAKNRFAPMMWSPVLNNLVVIAVMSSFLATASDISAQTITDGQVAFLGIGTTVGIAIQALVLIPVVRNSGVRLRPRFDFKGSGLGKSGRLASWSFLFVIVNQLGYLGIVNVATAAAARAANEGVGVGVGYTPYANAYLIFLLPHAIIAVSLVTALLPRMSRSAVEGNTESVVNDSRLGLEMLSITLIPAALGLALFAPLITTLLYAAADVGDARQIGWILMGFALGLLPFSAQHLLLRVFYAYEDTRTPLLINVVINVILVLGAITALITLPSRWVTTGMGATYAVAYLAGLIVTVRLIGKRIGKVVDRTVIRTAVQSLVAATVAMLPALGVGALLVWQVGSGPAGSALTLLIAVPIVIAGYLALITRMRVTGVDALWQMVRSRLHR
jgi:putative peptidoglycan lipid II flippase